VVQRVSEATVTIAGDATARIGTGLAVLVGVEAGGAPGRFALAPSAAWRLVRARTASAWRALCTARELEGLSDAQLKDIGLSREDIPRVARNPYSFLSR